MAAAALSWVVSPVPKSPKASTLTRDAESGRERKYYQLTRDGRTALKQEQQQWINVHNTLGKLWKLNPASI